MNQPLDSPESEFNQNFISRDSTIDELNPIFDEIVSCLDCRGLTFDNASGLHKHLIDNHIKTSYVLLQRLTPEFLRKLKQRKGRQRKGAFARKRSKSYIQPRVKSGRKTPLKLKLKVSGDSSSRSFEVVTQTIVPQTVLLGPGGVYPLNGGVIGEVKTEDLLTDVEWSKSLEGASEQPEVADSGERTFNEVTDTCEKENSRDSIGSNEDVLGDNVSDSDLAHSKDSDNDQLAIEKEELDIPPSPDPAPSESTLPSPPGLSGDAIASPIGLPPEAEEDLSPPPDDRLESEFLHSDSESNFPQSPNMVEINNSTVADVRSPSFPTASPSTPSGQPTPPSEQQSVSQSNEEQSSDGNAEEQDIADSDQLRCEDSTDGANTNNFVWTDVNATDNDINPENSNNQQLEERDPLLLNDSSTTAADECRNELQGSPNASSIDGTDQSILRGFLAEHGTDRTNVPVSGVSGLEGFSLGSEYISLERLGDNAVICDVCGERATDQNALQEHKFRLGHFKCAHPECGGVVFRTSDELLAHQQSIHGSSQFSQSISPLSNQTQSIISQQSAPVQQLVQQVQRLPVPQMTLQPLNKQQPPPSSTISQQLSSGMVSLISSQQNQFPVCRPPPLYPAPTANLMQQQHAGPPPYPGAQPQQHVMFPQPYPPQTFPGARQPVQVQPRPYSTMMQQMSQHTIRQQVPRVSVTNVPRNVAAPQGSSIQAPKRGVPVSSNSPGAKQRRLDMLIPDRHDDADCHVIAMQKRTDSGPLITGVQGSTNNSSGVPSSRQSDSTINLTDSITLSVRQQNVTANNNNNNNGGGKSRNDANTVASLLATRGITVTPAGGSVRGNPPSPQTQGQLSPVQHRTGMNRQPVAQPTAPPPPPAPQPVTTLNLNSAISIIPTASARSSKTQQQAQQPQQPTANFAVPQGRTASRPQQQAQVERPPRPPTVDLTGDGPPPPPMMSPMSGRGRGRGRGSIIGRHICQLCDKPFPTLDALNQHMVSHRPGKLPFRCNMCTAQYPTQQGLLQHRQTYHKEAPSQMGPELVLPVVDLKQPATLNRLNSLGVRHYIPLSQLSNQSGGVLGLPIVSLEGGRIPSASLSALGAATILTLGPLRQLPR